MANETDHPATAAADAPSSMNAAAQANTPGRAGGLAPAGKEIPHRKGAGVETPLEPSQLAETAPATPATDDTIPAESTPDGITAQVQQADGQAPGEPEAQAKLPESIRQKLLAAEIRSVGAELGLIDTEAALQLMPPDAVTVSADGDVTGVREALTELRQHKGYLFTRNGHGAWAQRMGESTPRLTGVEEAFYRKNPTLRK